MKIAVGFTFPLAFIFLVLFPVTSSAVEISDCKGPLEPSVKGGCEGIDDVGCCDLYGRNLYCQGGDLYCVDCPDGFDFCGWNLFGYYDCGQSQGAVDPSGDHPPACVASGCPAECHVDSPCSATCKGQCGHCSGEAICLESGECYTPQCQNKECGLDPKGFSCGSCSLGTGCLEALGQCMPLPEGCVATSQSGCDGCGCESCVCEKFPTCCTENWDILCIAACQTDCGVDCSPCPENPSCDGLECGDYCGVSCGKCPGAQVCHQFQCCTPDCAGKACGSDGCGGTCGICSGNEDCLAGECVACQPKCNGKDCGEDGCGGTCGQCTGSDKCIAGVCQGKTCAGSCGGQSLFECYCDGQCIEYGDCCPDVCEACPDICAGPSCDSVGWQGCCDGDSVVWCQDGELKTEDCSGSPSCGWNAAGGYYDCKTAGGADPSGEYPLVCKGTCFATCDGKECGDDGCGGSCGQCVGKWAVCTPEGVCCESSCAGKECGGDGCGGICGVCADGLSCDGSLCIDAIPEGCYPQETPGCGGCGCEACVIAKDDYCGDQSWDSVCATLCAEFCGADCPCIPDCDGKVCGPDGCGGTCGECDEGFYCSGVGQCTDECLGSCNGKECGDDGCGESCGSCDGGFHCSQGQCHLDCDGIPWEGCCDGAVLYYCDDGNLVTQQCEKNPACGWKGEFYDCGTEGNEAPDGLFPISCDGYCEPKCQDKVCGNDGCGGSCGECGDGEACVKGECVVSQCQGLPYEGCCAPDNVLWWCENAQLKDLSCTGKGPCGWNANEGYYNCATEGEPDPLGLFPMACPPGVGCQRDCTAKVCGDDGCMGSCGQCDAGLVCVEGQCLTQSPDESADVVVPVDGDAGRSDSVPGGGQAKKSGGCTAGGSGSPGALMLLFGLLALLALLALRRRNWSLLGLLILIGCSGNGSPYAPVTDTRSQDQSADSDTPGLLDIRTPEELAPDVLADLSSEFVGELKPLLEIVEDVGPEVLDVEEDTGPEFNCHAIPEGPFKLQKMPGVIASEDLAFDGKGYLVGSNNKAIFKSDPAGNSHIFSPNLKFRSGLAMLPSGWLVVNDNDLGRLVKVDPDGVQYTLLNGLKYPNGITIDMQGYIYVTEHDAHRVLRVHSYTGEYTVLTEEIGNPNGIAFNTDYTGLFIGTFGGSWVYYMSISPSGAPGKLIKWGDMTDTPGLLDGIAVDYCGNVYVCEYGETEIYRFTPDGQKREKIVDATELGTYLPNLRFGGGPGWSSTSLYSPDGWKPEDGVWRIDIGVPAPLLPFP